MTAPFHRYFGADEILDHIEMPKAKLDARSSNMCISELIGRFEEFTGARGSFGSTISRNEYPWAERFVMGYPLPKWQRPLVWAESQKIAFILSAWNGVDLGSYLINDIQDVFKTEDGLVYKEFSDVLLDGQQRLSALEDYLTDKFAVPDAAGMPRFWSEIPRIERRRFANTTFTRSTIQSRDEALLRYAYDMRAFGGTAHAPDQRATDVVPEKIFPRSKP